MKDYIYTIWTKPWKEKEKLFNIICIINSIELCKKIGKTIKIYTSSENVNFFKKVIKDIEVIPYLDDLKNLEESKWAFPKMYVLNSITSPVVHLDYDVFLFKTQKNFNCDIITQNFECEKFHYNLYKKVFDEFNLKCNLLDEFGEEMEVVYKNNLYCGFNCGYIDVQNPEASKLWTKKSIQIFNKIETFKGPFFNILPEQNLLYALHYTNKLQVETIFKKTELRNLKKIAVKKGYCHLMALKKNKNVLVFDKLLNFLKNNFFEKYKDLYNNIDNNFKIYLDNYEKLK